MPSPAWQTYLFPHRSHDTPAVVRLILAGLSGVILSFSYRGAYLSLYSWFCLALLIASIPDGRGWKNDCGDSEPAAVELRSWRGN